MRRAAVLGMKTLADDVELQAASQNQLTEYRRTETPTCPSAASKILIVTSAFEVNVQFSVEGTTLVAHGSTCAV
jgi:hypothetical protein